MTAAELASFRALLQAQAAPPPRPDRSLFARMRARLTVVEGAGVASAPTRARAMPPRLEVVAWTPDEGPVADPPPGERRLFGRRSHVAPEPTPSEAVPRPRRSPAFDVLCTPDELDDPRPPSAPPTARTVAPGVIAGWSRTRPPSAQRRLLGRLEAVLQAELQGLDARRAAEPTGT